MNPINFIRESVGMILVRGLEGITVVCVLGMVYFIFIGNLWGIFAIFPILLTSYLMAFILMYGPRIRR